MPVRLVSNSRWHAEARMSVYLLLFAFGFGAGILANHRCRSIHFWFLVGLLTGPIAIGLLVYLPKGADERSDHGLPGL